MFSSDRQPEGKPRDVSGSSTQYECELRLSFPRHDFQSDSSALRKELTPSFSPPSSSPQGQHRRTRLSSHSSVSHPWPALPSSTPSPRSLLPRSDVSLLLSFVASFSCSRLTHVRLSLPAAYPSSSVSPCLIESRTTLRPSTTTQPSIVSTPPPPLPPHGLSLSLGCFSNEETTRTQDT